MQLAGESQHVAENSTAAKFAAVERIIEAPKKTNPDSVRKSPQVSCTVGLEDKELLSELTLYACVREKKLINTSNLFRALIKIGNKYKEELEFD
jgi:hypothetical protein